LPPESLRPVYIEMMYSPDGPNTTSDSEFFLLAKGTGFFYKVDGQRFLVSARHNYTGKHWETDEFLHSSYRVSPTHVAVGFRASQPKASNGSGLEVAVQQYLLRLIDDSWKPVWREHARFGRSVDVAALAFHVPTDRDEVIDEAWDEAPPAQDPASKLWVSQAIAVVGYPYGLRGGFDLPTWIGGIIASEPAILHLYRGKEYPLFLVDARSRSGQSGSPVVTVRQPLALTNETGSWEVAVGPRWELVGVYTGRVPEDYGSKDGSAFGADLPPVTPPEPPVDHEAAIPNVDEEVTLRLADLARQVRKLAKQAKRSSDLGFVWRIQEATEICRAGVPGETGPVGVNPGETAIAADRA
jgi:hypothetical protein